ncbi:MAG TPA: T9SS type A sorting domain-containing protein, partial [Bacteroidota bacterium]|nr:T9SS type A sorting domain-containing protein [Bacteroidota bacterium]
NNDAYCYWTWQPNVPDDPFAVPPAVTSDPSLPGDPGGFNLINSDLWARLMMDTTQVVLSVRDITTSTGLPKQYSLSQNYPNPFNPSTKIEFALPRSGNVSLQVYNVLGQIVSTIASGQYNAGKYEVNWNANQLASGLYFYRLKVDNNVVDTRKMMLLK